MTPDNRISGPSSLTHDLPLPDAETLARAGLAGEAEPGFLGLSVDLVIIADWDYRFERVNPGAAEILGFTVAELEGRSFLDLVHPDDLGDTRAQADRIRATGEGTVGHTNRYRCRDGSYKWIMWSAKADMRERRVYAIGKDITEAREADEQVRRSRAALARAEGVAHMGSWSYDRAAGVVDWSAQQFRALGLEPGSCQPSVQAYLERIHPEDRRRVRAAVARCAEEGGAFELDHRVARSEGRWAVMHCRGERIEEDGRQILVGTNHDITERAQRERFAEAESAVADVLTSTATAQQAFERLPEAIGVSLGLRCASVWTVGDPAGEPVIEASWALVEDLQEEEIAAIREAAGTGRAVAAGGTVALPARAEGQTLAVLALGDAGLRPDDPDVARLLAGLGVQVGQLMSRKLVEQRLAHQALHDPLTGLPNRTLLLDRLDQALTRGARTGQRSAVLFIDVDDFKHMNDTRGHAAGDRFLREFGERVQAALRPTDSVARFGGDEFVVVAEGVEGPEAARTVAVRILESLESPFGIDGEEYSARASIGVALSEEEDHHPEVLLRHADLALYAAKEDDHSAVRLFDAALRSAAVQRRGIERALREAIESDELRLVYQPVRHLESGRPAGAEALLRWDHPEFGARGPGHFVAVAEETGLILPLGEWVLKRACADAVRLRDALGEATVPIAVNVSARQLVKPGLVDQVTRCLAAVDLPPEALLVEVTESALIDNAATSTLNLRKLRELGIGVLLDDFGTGFSSLSHLTAFPLDGLKIDRSFVQDLEDRPTSEAIVSAVAGMGRAFGLTVIAEGVETEAAAGRVRELGCHLAQGYHFARPMPFAELLAQLG